MDICRRVHKSEQSDFGALARLAPILCACEGRAAGLALTMSGGAKTLKQLGFDFVAG